MRTRLSSGSPAGQRPGRRAGAAKADRIVLPRKSKTTTSGSPTLVMSDTGPWLAPIGSASRSSEPTRHVISSLIAHRRARVRRFSSPIARNAATPASKIEASPSPIKNGWPASTNGKADMPAIAQKVACISRRMNADSGRLVCLSMPLTPVHGRDHGRIDVHRKRAPRGFVEPHVQHRRHADVNRAKRAHRVRRHEAELKTDRREANVLVLVPCRQRPAGVGAELIDVLHLKHRSQEPRPVL